MAIDAYLQIDGIKGESKDERHQGWVEVRNVHWNIFQPRSASVSTAGGHTSGRAELSDMLFTKMADLSSPILMQTCAMGKTIPKVKFEFMRADGNGQPVKYFEVELENVMLSHVTPSIEGGNVMQESVGLAFARAKWKYTQQLIGGGVGGNTAGGWDLAANKVPA